MLLTHRVYGRLQCWSAQPRGREQGGDLVIAGTIDDVHAIVTWLERQQVALYLAALALGAGSGVLFPSGAAAAEIAITPALGVLLYATFLGFPFATIGKAIRDWRFLIPMLVVNFIAVPIIVFPLSLIVAHERALLVGVLFVLLTPCVDYVIVFTGVAGGASDRLLAAVPLLMLGQMLLLPVYLRLFLGADFVSGMNLVPFLQAFVLLIIVPLAAAAFTQLLAAHSRAGTVLRRGATSALVPLMMLTLALVVASQVARIGGRIISLLPVIPVFLLFAAVMFAVGALVGLAVGMDVAGRRALVFSGITRNSLVVLPLVLALRSAYDLAPLVVVTQTLVELVVLVIIVRIVPRLIPDRATRSSTG